MKGGKQLRKIYIGSIRTFNIQDTILNECHLLPENIVSVCIHEDGTGTYDYLSES